MDFFDVVNSRQSVRKYQLRAVEEDKLSIILDTINKSPSAGNLQGYEVVVVHEDATKQAMMQAALGQPYISQAPVALVFCADHMRSAEKYSSRGAELYSVQDATIAAAYCELAANALGLATVWIGAFDPKAVGKAIGTPEGVTPVAIIPIGYADETPPRRPRRKLEDLVRSEKF